ncbi:MAG TPA: ATP-binding cassette domain-containing protein, partial [Armatimonadota bacterium]
MSSRHPLLEISGLQKSYHQVVLADVDFDLRAGEVHALVGENGAGKSTLSKIICGLTNPDKGSMLLRGKPYSPEDLKDAAVHGIRIVQQELNLIGTLTVAENMFLAELPNRFGIIDKGRLREEAAGVLDRLGVGGIDPNRNADALGIGQKQMVEVASGIMQECSVLILDEPTAALTDTECSVLFKQIEQLKASGTAVIYISHRMEEIRQISGRITVLRDGKKIGTYDTSSVSTEDIVRAMVGRDLDDIGEPTRRETGEVALRVEGLCSGQAVRGVDFQVHQGEILGFAGL